LYVAENNRIRDDFPKNKVVRWNNPYYFLFKTIWETICHISLSIFKL
jgi:hypothetical protein